MPQQYRYQLLRFAPNSVSDEFFNIAVVLRDADGRVVDARFTPDYRRMACHPLVEVEYLAQLRDEFEERRLLGEGFTEYLEQMRRHLSSTLTLSEEAAFFGGEPSAEMDRLVKTYVATPPGLGGGGSRDGGGAGSRTAVRRLMQRTFEELQLFRGGEGLRSGVEVAYAGELTFSFDYGYQPAGGGERYLHALGSRNDETEASRLCLVYDRISGDRSGGVRELTAVLAEEVSDKARALLESSRIEAVEVRAVRALGERVREELGW